MDLIRDGDMVVIDAPGGVVPIRQILGIGRNYAEHAAEQAAAVPDRPMVFAKNIASVALDGEPIVIPAACRDEATGGPAQVDYEAELAVIIGRAAKDVAEADAFDFVLGYCCANDVSARWWQKQGSGGQFTRGKSFDTFCPLGPRVTPAAAVGDPQSLGVRCRVSGETLQDGNTSDMVFSVAQLISELSRGATLVPGTVILTGTPSGVGMARDPQRWLTHGDFVEVEIDEIGVLKNPVADG